MNFHNLLLTVLSASSVVADLALTEKNCTTISDCEGDASAFCDQSSRSCACNQVENSTISLIVIGYKVKCITGKGIGDPCVMDAECHVGSNVHSHCNPSGQCSCVSGFKEHHSKGCHSEYVKPPTNTAILPLMIVMGIMFAGMCVALNLFSRARFQNTRSVFNSSRPIKKDDKGKRRPRRTSKGSSLQHGPRRGQSDRNGAESPETESLQSFNQATDGETIMGQQAASSSRETAVLMPQ
ncbi:hypothetical protein HDE_08852 [Halotydeus destructor]|nr:hypothetical protein HDE_08852 [Halotydeus destructor]